MRKLEALTFVKYWITTFLLSVLGASAAYSQTATPLNDANAPRHHTIQQQHVAVYFNIPLTGTTTTAQWTITVNGNNVTETGVSATEFGPVWGANASPTGTVVSIQFDASYAGHAETFILPTDVVRVSFANTGTTLKTASSGNNVANFNNFQSKNYYVPLTTGAGDVLPSSEGPAGLVDQCSPVNTNFYRWTYGYTLRWRNSSRFVLADQKLNIVWNGAPNTNSVITGFLSDNAGGANTAYFDQLSFGGSPRTLITFRPGYSAAAPATPDVTNGGFTYSDNTDLCNFRATGFPSGTTAAATWSGTGQPTLQLSKQFDSYDYDNDNTGIIDLTIITPPANSTTTNERVCLGTNVGSRFTDTSTFNCIGNGTTLTVPGQGAVNNPINNQQRWVRFIYGGATAPAPGNIRDVVINGNQVTNSTTGALMPAYDNVGHPILPGVYADMTPNAAPMDQGYVFTGGTADANGVITLAPGATAASALSELITTSQVINHAIGQRFYVTLQYWNVCNPYPTSAPIETSVDFVEIVTIPTVPVAGTSPAVCNGNTPAAFNITGAAANSTVRWYADASIATPITSTTANAAGASSITVPTGIPGFVNTNAGNYTVYASYISNPGGIACESPRVAITRTVREAISNTGMSIKLPAQACPGASVTFILERPVGTTFTVPTNPIGGATAVTWTVPAALGTITSAQGGNSITVTLAAAPTTQAVSAVWAYTTTPNCGVTINSSNYAMLAPPAIGTQPVARTVCENVATTFAVTGVTGSGSLGYQWFVDDGGGFDPVVDDGTIYTGALTPTLTVTPNFGMNGYQYRAVVTAVSGGCSPAATSTTRGLTVQRAPFITTPPPNRTICIGQNTTFTVTAGGQATLGFQWQVDTGSGFVNIANGGVYGGATTNTLTITGATGAMNAYQYHVVVTSSTCSPAATSAAGTLTMRGPTTTITNGTTAAVCAGNNLNLTATESFLNGTFASRAWTGTYDENGAAAPALIVLTNAQLDALLTDGVGGSRRTQLNPIFNSAGLGVNKVGPYVLTLTTTDNNGCTDVKTITVTVGQVDANILYGYTAGTVSQTNLNAPVCSGFDLFLDGNPSGGSGTFTTHAWTKISGPGGAIGTLLNSATSRTPTFNTTTVGAASTYVLRYTATDNLGCTFSTITKDITIVVNPLPTAAGQTPTVCSDPTTPTQATVNLTAQNNAINPGPGVTITWFTGYNAGTKTFTGAIATPASFVVTNAVPVFARVADNVTTCPSPATVTYTVNPTPNLVTGQVKTICSGANTAYEILLTPANSPATTVFNWAAPTMSAGGAQGTAGVNVASGPAGTLHINDVLVNTTGSPITATYTITPSTAAPACAGTARTVVITVNPAPVVTAAQTKTICSGQAVNKEIFLTPLNLPTGSRFSWPAPTMSAGAAQGSAGTNVVMGAAGTLHITDVLTNTSGAPITATYNITPNTTPAGCTGAMVPVVITINPSPVIVAGQTKTICSGDAVNHEILLNPLNAPTGTRFSWPVPTMSAGAAQGTAQTNVLMGAAGTFHITDVLTNTTGSPITATYTVTPNTTPAGCTGTARTIVITINPAPALNTGQVKTICSGENVDYRILLTPNNMPAGTTFTWAAPTMSAGGAQGTGRTAVPAADLLHITDALINTTTSPITATYTITPTSGATCVGTARTVVVTINPRPVANPIVGQGTVCAGPNIILYQVNPNVGSTYAWTINPLFQVFGGGGVNDFFVLLKFPATGSGNISVIETNSFPGKNCSGAANVFPITVAAAPGTLDIDGPDPVCKSQTGVVYEIPTLIFNPASTYTWSASGANIVSATSGVGLRQITVDFGLLASATITVNETSSSGCAGTPTSKVISVSDKPTMTSATTTSTCSGSAPSLNFTASLPSLFQWQVITVTGGISGTTVGNSGTGNLNEVLTNTTGFTGTVIYRVTPMGSAAPNCAGASQDVTVTVNPEPVLALTNKTLCSDQVAGYEIKLFPLNLPPSTTFTWAAPTMSAGAPQGSAGTMIPMGAAGTIHINDAFVNTGTTSITATYVIQATSGLGCNSNQPAAARTVVFTIHPKPVGANDNTPVVCSKESPNYSLATNITTFGNNLITGTTYTWQAISNGSVTGESFASAQTTATITDVLRNVSNSNQIVIYNVVPTSVNGCAGTPFTVSVTVNPEPKGYNDPDEVTCSDIALAYNLSGNVGNTGLGGNGLIAGTTYEWAAAVNPNVSGASTTAQNSVTISDVLTNITTVDQVVVYTVTPTSVNSCVGDPFTVTVTVRPEPVGANSTATKCSDEVVGITLTTSPTSAAAANFTIAVNPNGLTQVAGTNSAGINKAANELADDVWRNTTAAAVSVVYTVTPISGAGCSGNNFTVTVTINPEPIGVAQTPIRCSDEVLNVTLGVTGASVAAATYNITVNGNGLTFSGTTASAGNGKLANELADDKWTNNGLNPVDVTYTVNPVSAAGCVGDAFTVIVTVNPEPVGTAGTATRCSDELVNFPLTTSATAVAAATFDIATNANGLVQSAGTVSAGNGKLANELLDDRWTNPGLNPVNVVYTVIPVSAAGCAGDPFTVTITVRPEPVGSNSSVSRCSDELVNVTIATDVSSVAAATYDIAVNANGLTFSGTTASNGNGKLANELMDDRWTNVGLSPVNVIYTITPISSLSCSGNPFTITVTVRPEPVGSNSTATVCSDVALGVTLTTSATAVAAANYSIAVNPNGLIQSGGTVSAGSNKLANELSDDVWRNTGLSAVTVVYTITPFSAAGCAGNDYTVTVTVNPEPVGSNSATTICANSPVSVNLSTNPASVAAATYNIAVNPNGLTLATGSPSAGTGKAATEIADDVWANIGLGPVSVIYTITPVSVDGCLGDPFTVTVTVNPQPVGAAVAVTRCSDSAVGVALTTSATAVAASSYNIATANGGLTQSAGTVSAGNGKAANELVDDVWRNTGLNPVDVVYTVRPVSAAGCIGDPFTITVTVDPEPVGANSTATRCSDEVLGVTLTTSAASVSAATYNILVNANGLTLSAGTASAGTGKAANELADDVWRNTGLSPVNVIYTITPVSASLCQGDNFTVTVTVNPEPVGANSTASKCSDEVLAINLTTSGAAVAAANFTIAVNPNGLTQVAGTNSAGSSKAANELADDVWRNSTNAPVDVTYTITPFSAAGCAGDDFTVIVTINPEPIGVAQTPTRCSDELVAVTMGVTGASAPAATYNVAVNANGLVFSGTTPSAGNGRAANELADDRWTNTGLIPVAVTYTINPVSGSGCIGDAFTITVTVNPEPVGAAGTATRCSDEVVNFALTTNATAVAAATFDIATNANGLTQSAGTVSAGTGKAANELLDDAWTNTGLNPVNVVYTVTPFSAAGCAGNSFTVTVTVRPEPVGTPATVSRCSDELVNLTIGTDLTAVPAGTYNIAVNANGLIFSGTSASAGNGKLANELMDDKWTNTGLAAVNVVYTITPISGAGCSGDPFDITVTVRPEPVGANSTATICSDVVLGINLTTSATAVAAANYTIAVNPNGLVQSAGTNSAGANKLANELADDVWRNTGLASVQVVYTITPFSAAGCAGDNFTVTITVNPEPVGSNSTTTVCANDAVSVSLSTNPASVAAATFNIAINPNGLTLASGTPSAGNGKLANEISDDVWANAGLGPVNVIYTITPVSAGPASCSGDPFTVTVTVNPQPVGSNVTVTRCSDIAVGLTLSTSVTAVPASSYNIATANGGLTQVLGTVSAGNGKAANELSDDVWRNTGLIPVDVTYTVRPVSASGCVGDPFTVIVTVNPEPVGANSTATRCSDEVVNLTLSTNASSVAAATYTIAVNTGGLTLSAGTPSAGTGKAANEIEDDVWRNTTLNPVDVTYTITPVSAALCDGNAFTVIVTVNPEPVGANTTVNKCSDEVLGITLTTSAASVAAANYTIAVNPNGLPQVGGTNSAGPGKAANEIADDVWRNLTNAPVNVVYTITPMTAAPCAGDDFTVTVTINPEPIGVAQAPTRCSDELVNVTLGTAPGSVAATTYDIAINANGLTFSGTTASAGNGKLASELMDDKWTNTGLTPVNVEYTITPVSGALCQGDPFTVTVTVNPEPVGTNGTATRCSDELVSVALSTSATAVAASTYNISIVSNGLTFSGTTASAGTGKLANELMDDKWTNDGLIPVNVIYTITPVSAAGCAGDPFTVNVTVRPEPVGFDSTVALCSDQAVGFTLSTNGSSVAAQSYTIAVNANGLIQSGGSNSAGPGKAANELFADVWRNTGTVAVDVVYTIIPVSAAPALCQGDPFTVTVTVNPEPVGADLPVTKCSDEVSGIMLTTSGASVAADSYNITVTANGLTQSAGTPSAGTNMPANAIADDAWRNITIAPVNVIYKVVPVTAAPESCEGNEFTVTLTVNPEPVGQDHLVTDCSTTLNYNIQTANINAFGNSLPSIFTYTVSSSDELSVPTPVGLDRTVANSDPITDSFVNLSSAAVDVTYLITPFNAVAPACGGTPFIYRVRISPKPVGVDNTKPAVCSDVAFNFDPQADLSPSVASTFTWTVTYDVGITVRVAKTPQTGNIAETLTNETPNVLNAVYTVTPTATGSSCVGDAFDITVPINPEPVVVSGVQTTQCSDIAYGLSIGTEASAVAAANFDIAAVADPGLTGVPTTGVTLAANAIMGDMFTNLNAAQLLVTYTVTPRAATGCLGDAEVIIFKVNPEPVMASQAIPDVCSSNIDNPSITNIVLGTNGTSINAQFYRLDVVEYKYVGDPTFGAAPAGFTPGPGNRPVNTSVNANTVRNDSYNNVSDRGVIVKYTFTPISPAPASCVGDALDFEITINPQPTIDPLLSPTPVCSDLITAVTLRVDPALPSVAAASYTYIGAQFPGLIAGTSNANTGVAKPANVIFNDTYTNTTSGPLPAVYTFAARSAAGCTGLDTDITLNINPAPNLFVAPAVACNDAVSQITLTGDPSAVGAATYDLISVTVDPDLTPTVVATPNTGVAANYLNGDRFVNATNTVQIVEYRVKPVSAASCRGPEEIVQLTVEPRVVAVPTPALETVCGDGNIATNVVLNSPTIPSAGNISFRYTAVPSSPQVSGFSPTATFLPNPHTIADLLVNNSDVVRTVVYTVTPSAPGADNGLGCTGLPVPVTITVEPKPKLVLPATKTVCEDVALAIVLNSPTVPSSGAASVFYDLTTTPTGTVTGFSATGTPYTNGQTLNDVLSNGDPLNATVEYKFTPRFGTCVGSETIMMVTVAPRPVIDPIGPFHICSQEILGPVGITVDTQTANPGFTFISWTVSPQPAGVTGATPGGGDSFTQAIINKSANPQTLTYTMSARNVENIPACNGAPISVLVTVYPEPKLVGLPTSVNVCNNETKNITLNSSASGTTYTWLVDNNSNPDLPIIGPGGGPVINQTFVNNGDALGNYLYSVTPSVIIPSTLASCDGIVGNMIVNVAPSITGSLTVSGDDEAFICRGSTQQLTFQFGGLALFDYTYTDGTTTKTILKSPLFDNEPVTPLVTTDYTLLSVKDGFGCLHNPTGQTVRVNVGSTAAAFTIDGPPISCSPYQVKFKHDQVSGTNYNWRWNDGIADSTYLAGSDVTGQTVLHTFFNPAPKGNQGYDVFLEAFLSDDYPNGCRTSTKQKVTIYPTVAPAIFADKETICSGETVRLTNSTQGATSQKWFYRVPLTSTEIDVKTTPNASFVLPNTTSSNPLVYEIVFQSTNGNCDAPEQTVPITVYRGVDAAFDNTTPTVFIGGHSAVTFTNTSTPVDGTDFRYEWDFGANGNPGTSQGVGPFNLDYTTPGPKEIALLATNIMAEAAGFTCSDEFRKTITIIVPPLIAEFTAVPLEACFPTDITITENKATGDKFAWRVLDNAGTAAQSNAELPVFKIPAPGKYTIELVTSNSFTGDQKTATKDVIIYDLPMASFDVRPGVVYVPDTELNTYNFSDGATSYSWDFGDGTVVDEKEPTHKYRIEGVYDVMLIAMNDHGNNVVCVDTLIRKVTAKQGGVTRVPNAFTPNPNGPTSSAGVPGVPGSNTFNDVFLPQVKGAEEFNMQVFDRWGNLIFESNNSNVGWDGYDRHGRLMPSGVYVYKLTLRLSDGQRTTQVGDITMIR